MTKMMSKELIGHWLDRNLENGVHKLCIESEDSLTRFFSTILQNEPWRVID